MFIDALTLDAPRKTKDGYMAVRARAARTGVYAYTGSEVDPDNKHGLRDAATVHVLRDDKTVFDEAAARSFIGKPVTDDHPSEPVTSANWKDHARGMVMGAMRDGDYLAFDLLLTDAAAIKKVDDGKRELSNGYGAELEFGDFTATDGTKCQARQVQISGNHVALVDRGRAGSECKIADAAACDAATVEVARLLLDQILTDERTYSGENRDGINEPARRETSISGGSHVATKTITFDGLPLEVTDAAEAAITKLLKQIDTITTDKAAVDTKVGELTATISTKDGEIAALNQKLKDAEVSPAKLGQMVADRATLVSQAKAVDANIVTDGKSEAEIRKAVVATKLGDAAKDLDDAAISGAFKVLTAGVKVDPVREAISNGVVTVGDAKAEYEKARDKARSNLSDAWRPAVAAA